MGQEYIYPRVFPYEPYMQYAWTWNCKVWIKFYLNVGIETFDSNVFEVTVGVKKKFVHCACLKRRTAEESSTSVSGCCTVKHKGMHKIEHMQCNYIHVL